MNGMTMRLGCLLVSLAMAQGVLAGHVTTADLSANPGTFDGAVIVLRGTVSQVQLMGPDIDSKGRQIPVHVFLLTDGQGSMLVVAAGKPVCAPGAIATVEGTFSRSGQPRVQAKSVRC